MLFHLSLSGACFGTCNIRLDTDLCLDLMFSPRFATPFEVFINWIGILAATAAGAALVSYDRASRMARIRV